MTDRQLVKIVDYEVSELVGTARELTQLRGDPILRGRFWNSVLEAWVVHVRNLVDFLYGPGNRIKTDICADTFLPSWKPGPLPERLGTARNRAHKQLAHISRERMALDGQSWETGEVTELILGTFNRFLSDLRESGQTWPTEDR